MKNNNNYKIQEKSYMSLKKISSGYKTDASWVIDKWLSEPTTLEFIELWENLHNLDFDHKAYEEICTISLSTGDCPTISELKNKAHIKSIFIDKDFNSDVFVHTDLAIDFSSWLSPAFRTYCLLLCQDTDMNNSFKSEEDFIISKKTLAEYTKQKALKNYKRQVGSFVYNFRHVECK